MSGRRFLICALLATSLAGSAHAADEAAQVTALLRACEGRSAQFVQRFLPKGYKKATVERGRVVFGPLPSMRWSYASPEAKEFVFDGTTTWLWVPADRQVTVHDMTADERAALPFFALSEPSRIAAAFTLSKSGRKTTLKARDRGALLTEVAVESSADGRLASLGYVDSQGNSTTFEFSGFAAAETGPETFRFAPPEGADVVRN